MLASQEDQGAMRDVAKLSLDWNIDDVGLASGIKVGMINGEAQVWCDVPGRRVNHWAAVPGTTSQAPQPPGITRGEERKKCGLQVHPHEAPAHEYTPSSSNLTASILSKHRP